MSLLNFVLCVLVCLRLCVIVCLAWFVCSRACMLGVLPCLCGRVLGVFACLHTRVLSVLKCSSAYVLTWSACFFVLCPYVLTCLTCLMCSISYVLAGVCVCVCVCVWVFTSIHRKGFTCLSLKFQGADQWCCVEVTFLCQVPSSLL